MAVTNYYTVNGEIIGEKVGAGARTDYLTDALGSVTATLNQSAQVVNTYRYKPYGGLLAKTGVGADPAFQWVGSQGYRQTSKRFSDVYVRARHYDTMVGRWTSKDPLWPQETQYCYVAQNAVNYLDASGLLPQQACCCEAVSITVKDLGATGADKCGNKFTAEFAVNDVPLRWPMKGTQCQLEWWEKCHQFPHGPGKGYSCNRDCPFDQDTWTNQNLKASRCHLPGWWDPDYDRNNLRRCPPGGLWSFVDYDEPGFGPVPGEFRAKTLCFVIVLKNPPNEPWCKKKTIKKYLKQTTMEAGGQCVVHKLEISDQPFPGYCGIGAP